MIKEIGIVRIDGIGDEPQSGRAFSLTTRWTEAGVEEISKNPGDGTIEIVRDGVKFIFFSMLRSTDDTFNLFFAHNIKTNEEVCQFIETALFVYVDNKWKIVAGTNAIIQPFEVDAVRKKITDRIKTGVIDVKNDMTQLTLRKIIREAEPHHWTLIDSDARTGSVTLLVKVISGGSGTNYYILVGDNRAFWQSPFITMTTQYTDETAQ